MSNATAKFLQAVDDIFSEMADAATFIHGSDDPVDCTVIVNVEADVMPSGYSSGGMDERVFIEVKNAEIGRRPVNGDIFEVDGVRYVVDSISVDDDDITSKCIVRVSS